MSVRFRAACMVLLTSLCSHLGWAQAPSLEVQPSTIPVSPSYSGVEVRVILKNGQNVLTKPALTWVSNDGLQAEIEKPSAESASAAQVIVWRAIVKNLGYSRLPGTILFDAQFIAGSNVQHAFANLSLTSQADAPQKAIDASVEGNLDAISEQRAGSAYVIVSNTLDIPIRMTIDTQVPTTAKGPVFKKPDVEEVEVPARSSAYRLIVLRAENRTTPGTYPVLFSLTAEWEQAGTMVQRHLVLSKTATAGVFFESDLLKLLGVPSFLLLPGCLFLFTVQLFLSTGVLGVKNDSRLAKLMAQLTISSPGFWIIAVSVSACFAIVYTFFTGNNYLFRYGAEDIRNVWLASIVLGGAVYLGYAVYSLKYRRQYVPTPEDDPITLLKKMGRNGVRRPLSMVSFKLGSIDLQAYVAERIEDGLQSIWVAPPICVQWNSTTEAREAAAQFETAVNEQESWPDLAARLDAARKLKQVVIYWATDASSSQGPYHLRADAITAYLQPANFFRIS